MAWSGPGDGDDAHVVADFTGTRRSRTRTSVGALAFSLWYTSGFGAAHGSSGSIRLVRERVGRPEPALVTLSGSLFLFIAACNLAGQLPGVRLPTASLATTSALAVIVFLAVPVVGIRARGYRLGFFRPNPMRHGVDEVWHPER